MTVEEKIERAKDIICKNCKWNGCDNNACPTLQETIEAIELGLTEGKPKWHDLRKNPDDLPKEKGKYIIHIEVSEKRTITDTCDFFNGHFGQYIEPIAWCELPKFEEMGK